MNAKNFKYYHIIVSSIPRALSEQKYNLIGSLETKKDKPKIIYGRLPKQRFIQKHDLTIPIKR